MKILLALFLSLLASPAFAAATAFDLSTGSWILDWSSGATLKNVYYNRYLRVFFPAAPGHINELTIAPASNILSGKRAIQINLIVRSTDAAWGWPLDACVTPYPTYAHFFLQRVGDDWLGTPGTTEFYRWWSQSIPLQPIGLQKVVAKLSPDQWTSVWGKAGTANSGMFYAAVGNVARLGLTFGGGCAFAHGVWLNGGSANLTIRWFGVY